MSERDRILALTQAAFLSAVAFTFLSIQFVMPPSFVVLLGVVPAIFGLQAYHVPLKLAGLAGVLVIVLSSVMFGVTLGVWAGLYFVVGSVLGIGWRYRLPLALRLLVTSLASVLSLLATVAMFGWMANIRWQEVAHAWVQFPVLDQTSFLTFLATGLVFWCVLFSLGADRFLAQVLRHIHVDPR